MAEDLGVFELDAAKIGDAIVNLLTNAIKFTPDGGELLLEARLPAPDEAEIRVVDRGIGVEPRALSRMFQPFFTEFDPSYHSSGDFGYNKRGLGLGLSIVKQFVEMHGGRASAESVLGEGTAITIRLPRHPPRHGPPVEPSEGHVEAVAPDGPPAAARGADPRCANRLREIGTMPTALIVEDEPAANDLLSALVQLRGYRTDSAFTGTEALEKVGLRPPDVVFLDLMLPDINGFEVCQSLKADESTRKATVVVVTARVAVENRIQSFLPAPTTTSRSPTPPTRSSRRSPTPRTGDAPSSAPRRRGSSRSTATTATNPCASSPACGASLLALTPLDGDAVVRLGAFLIELWKSADAWGRDHDTTRVADLAYRLDARGISLEVLDGPGWLAGDPMSREPGLRAAIEAAGFRKADGHGEAKLHLSFVEERPSPGHPGASPADGHHPLEARPRKARFQLCMTCI